MLRTSLRLDFSADGTGIGIGFLSSNAQDFIEVRGDRQLASLLRLLIFLSSNAQDFIEVANFTSSPSLDMRDS